MNMRICHNHPRPRKLVFEKAHYRDVILAQHPIKHIIRLFEIWSPHSTRSEFHQVGFDQLVLGRLVECCAEMFFVK